MSNSIEELQRLAGMQAGMPGEPASPDQERIERAVVGDRDNERAALRKELLHSGAYSLDLVKMLDQLPDDADFPHWWQGKIIEAVRLLDTAKHYLEGEMIEMPANVDMPVDELAEDASDQSDVEKAVNEIFDALEQIEPKLREQFLKIAKATDQRILPRLKQFIERVRKELEKIFAKEPQLTEGVLGNIGNAIGKIAKATLGGISIIVEAIATIIDLVINAVKAPLRALGVGIAVAGRSDSSEGNILGLAMLGNISMTGALIALVKTGMVMGASTGIAFALAGVIVFYGALTVFKVMHEHSAPAGTEPSIKDTMLQLKFSAPFREARQEILKDLLGRQSDDKKVNEGQDEYEAFTISSNEQIGNADSLEAIRQTVESYHRAHGDDAETVEIFKNGESLGYDEDLFKREDPYISEMRRIAGIA